VIGWRLRRHHLDGRAPAADLLPVVSQIAGLHARIMSSAELTVWARVDGLEQLEAMLGAIEQSLDGQVLSREALAAEVARRTGSPELGGKLRSGWGSMLKPAASRGKLCFGPSEGQRVCFTRPDQWLAGWREEDPEAALLETARRYLRAAGVVTREDYARWWGVLAPRGGKVLHRLGDELVPVEVGGWRSPSSRSPGSPPGSAARPPPKPNASPPGPAPPSTSPGRRADHPGRLLPDLSAPLHRVTTLVTASCCEDPPAGVQGVGTTSNIRLEGRSESCPATNGGDRCGYNP
jgi:hypothetical protein